MWGSPSRSADGPAQALTLFDATCLIVGIIVGAGIYQTTPDVARGAGGPWGVLALWLAGGALSLCGALGYAELATAYPREGGDYVYLGRAYGRWAGFLFGWAQLAVVRPGDIAVMALVCGTFAQRLLGGPAVPYAAGAVLALTAVNALGVRAGKWTQNALTVAKLLGLLALVGVACAAPPAPAAPAPAAPLPASLALILVLFTFGGWNEMAYVAAEVRDPRRNIVRALVSGTAAVTAVYLLVNAALLRGLGYAGLTRAGAVTDIFPAVGARLISALICVSALGAVNGLIFAGARISFALGAEHRIFGWLGCWAPRTGTPARALLLQGALAAALILALGSFLNAILYTAAAVYTFYLATTLAVIVLRHKEPQVERPYRVTGYPLTPLAFCAVCGFLIYSAIRYQPGIAALSCLLWPTGLLLYWWSGRLARRGGPRIRNGPRP